MPGYRNYKHSRDGTRQAASPARSPHSPPAARGTIEISEFSLPARPSLTGSRVPLSAAAAITSVLLHLGALTPVIWAGARQQPSFYPPAAIGASRAGRTDEIALQWVTLNETATAHSDRISTPVFSRPELTPIALTVKFPQLAADLLEEPSQVASPIVANESVLRGLYIRQINARIDRAWLRPRSPIADVQFHCQVRVEQDAAGNVTEVVLERCNGSPRWQLSLVHAIESASPLPAPSDPSVFAHAIHMSFAAAPVESAVSLEQYESASVLELGTKQFHRGSRQ